MLPRERVIMALNHQTPDRVPLDFWVVPEIQDKLMAHFHPLSYREVLDRLGVDILLFSPKYVGPSMPKYPDGSYREPMGTIRIKVANKSSVYDEYAKYPLGEATTIEELEEFMWPKPKWWDFDYMGKTIGDSHEKYYIKMETGGLFELAWGLTGMEKFFIDMIMNPKIPHYIMNKITEFYCEYIKRAMEACGDKIDMIYTYDDIAGQNGLLMSQDMLEEFVFPYHRRLNSVIKSYNKTIMYHSCGAITQVIDRLGNLPIDVLNPLQPRAKDMDFKTIKKKYGNRLSFHGGIDIQYTLVNGSPEKVRRETIQAIDTLGKNGGYILTSAHYIQGDSPIENILAMYDTARNYQLDAF